MVVDPRTKVAVVCGGLPLDWSYLEVAAQAVNLTVHRSSWQPPGTSAGTPSAVPGVTLRDYAPILRSSRGRLAYVFPGLHKALTRDEPDVVHVISEPWGLL